MNFAPHHESFRVRAYEVGDTGNATLQHVCNYFQEIASNHADMLGFGFGDMTAHGLAWFLSRLRVAVERYPAYRETVTVRTWPSFSERLTANREYLLLDETGAILARAASSWAVYDVAALKPARLPEWLHGPEWPAERALEMPKRKPGAPRNELRSETMTVRAADTDMNHHANHTAVLAMALESVPDDLGLGRQPSLLDILFRAEARRGEHVASTTGASDEPHTLAHTLTRTTDHQELARALTAWPAT
jgi:acyl-ACP thioesterase